MTKKEEIYNVKTIPKGYRIVKYDHLLNIERTYEIHRNARGDLKCFCAAGEKPTCRHRDMLFIFLRRDKVNTHWFLNYTTGLWEEHIKVPKAGEV